MRISETENGVVLNSVQDFDAKHIFECGQCFRWYPEGDGSYTGVAMGKVINVRSDFEKHLVYIDNTDKKDTEEIWIPYFDLETDYGEIKNKLREDPTLNTAIKFGEGIRILNQDVWETIISFIISSNNNIPRIQKIIARLSESYGMPIEYRGKTYYTFPDTEKLAKCSQEEIDDCKAGFRCRYIYETTKKIAEREVDIDELKAMSPSKAKAELMKLTGVGPKVADCVKLFALHQRSTYPVDVWVKKVTEYFYIKEETGIKNIEKYAAEHFGDLAGYAQQYLFYYGRETKLSEKIG